MLSDDRHKNDIICRLFSVEGMNTTRSEVDAGRCVQKYASKNKGLLLSSSTAHIALRDPIFHAKIVEGNKRNKTIVRSIINRNMRNSLKGGNLVMSSLQF